MILKRIAETEDGTFGVLLDAGVPFALTCEPEDKDNQQGISCIPEGAYECKRRMYHRRGYEVFEVTDVPNRTNILFHRGNTEDDTQGCILIGEQFEALGDKAAVLNSGKGFQEFMKRLYDKDTFTLYIERV